MLNNNYYQLTSIFFSVNSYFIMGNPPIWHVSNWEGI